MIEISCPSGLTFTARRMFGGAYQAMAKVIDRGTQLEAAATGMDACGLEVLDPGPYSFIKVGTKPDLAFWRRAWAVDLMVSSIQLRLQSFPRDPKVGKELTIEFNCQNCRKKTDNWLLPDIGIYLRSPRLRQMPNETRNNVRAGGFFERVVDGKRVRFDIQRLQQDADMREVLKRNAPGQRTLTPVELVTKQLKFVEGLKAQNMLSWWRWAANQDAEVLDDLLAAFYATEGTLDSTTRVVCQSPDCGIEQDIQLPFGGRAFWSPKRAAAEEAIWLREKNQVEEMETTEETETTEQGNESLPPNMSGS